MTRPGIVEGRVYPVITGSGGMGGVSIPPSGNAAVPWSYAQADGGLAGDGTTDDSALLNTWIDTITASGTQSGWFWFEPGVYLIAGALQDTGAFNAQVLLPSVSTSDPQITLTFSGAARPPMSTHGGVPTGDNYSVIKSTLTGASGTAAVFSGGNGSYPGTQNNIQVSIENLLCLMPDDPTMTFWNFAACQGGAVRNIFITGYTHYDTFTASAPTHSNAYGVKLPQVRNSNYTYVDGLAVYLYYTGLMQGELGICRGLIFAGCVVAVEFTGVEHASLIVDVHATSCVYVFKATGTHYADILNYDFETTTGPGWADIVYDLDDASNYLHGSARYWGYPAPPTHSFTKNGGTNFSSAVIGPLSSGASFATPSIALGTAAAAGAASTVIRSDSTIVAFDATVPTTQAFSDAAATGSAAVAARRDHLHGMPATPAGAAHYLVIASSHSTPLIFGDLVQTTAGDDLIYTS